MKQLGGVVAGTLRGMQSLSARLKDRSVELKTALEQK